MTNTSVEVILKILFLALSNADVSFAQKKFTWRSYTNSETLSTTRQVKVIGQKEFATAALDPDEKDIVVYIVSLSLGSKIAIHSVWEAKIAALVTKKVIVPPECSNYANIFSEASVAELPEHNNINEHPIDLVDNKQPFYGPIYSLGPVELETLKTYIEIILANGFIRPSQLPAIAPILFIKKKNYSLWLYVNYQGRNNLTIKNWYLLPLIGESLDRLNRAKCFTQLDLINTYH